MLQILPCQLFSFVTFSNEIELVLKFLPRKKEVKTPAKREVVGLWLHFYTTIRLLFPCSWEPIFVVLQEATTSIIFVCHIVRMQATSIAMMMMIIFLCRITRSNNKEYIFHVVSQEATTTSVFLWYIAKSVMQEHIFHLIAMTQATSCHPIARRTLTIKFFVSYCNEWVTMIIFFLYCEGVSDDYMVLQGSKPVHTVLQGRMKTAFNHREDAR